MASILVVGCVYEGVFEISTVGGKVTCSASDSDGHGRLFEADRIFIVGVVK